MLFLDALQADCHPGNILVTPGGCETIATGMCTCMQPLCLVSDHLGVSCRFVGLAVSAAMCTCSCNDSVSSRFAQHASLHWRNCVCLFVAAASLGMLLIGVHAPSSELLILLLFSSCDYIALLASCLFKPTLLACRWPCWLAGLWAKQAAAAEGQACPGHPDHCSDGRRHLKHL